MRKESFSVRLFSYSCFAFFAGVGFCIHHYYFLQERSFPKNSTGILVLRIAGDNARSSFQSDLVENLNGKLQDEAENQPIEVHAGRETIDADNGLSEAHQQARAIGAKLNAKLVIWGRIGIDNKFYPRITIIDPLGTTSEASEKTLPPVNELSLPDEFVEVPFYLIHFTSAYSYLYQGKYQKALDLFKEAIDLKGGASPEIGNLQFYAGYCDEFLAEDNEDKTKNLLEAIEFFKKAADNFKGTSPDLWAQAQNNLGVAFSRLAQGDATTNLQNALSAMTQHCPYSPKKIRRMTGLGLSKLRECV